MRQFLFQDEELVNQYLGYLKWLEFNRTKPAVHPSRPVQEVLSDVVKSDLYEALRTMPKGGNMHIHEGTVLQSIKIILQSRKIIIM